MQPQPMLDGLVRLAESIGITVRFVSGPAQPNEHSGGALVRLKGAEVIFLDGLATVEDQIAVVAGALHGREQLEKTFIPPRLREIIERSQRNS